MPDTADQVLDVAITAARQAAALIRKESGSVSPDRVSTKGVHDLVTNVDRASQSLIVSAINSHFPSHLVLAEEDEHHDMTPQAPEGVWRWIIDPIDGTTNFMHGVPPFAVSIGVQCGARTEVGVVLDVSRDELFSAVRGRGLRVNGAPARVSRTDHLGDALLTTGFPYREFAHIDQYLAVLKTFMRDARGVRRPGSASVDLAWVASGRFDGFFETGLSPWDVAAGMLLVNEGGGRVTDYSGSPEATFARQVVASNGRIHEEMLSAVQPMRLVRG